MANDDGDAPPQAERLFDNVAFHLTNKCPMKSHFTELITVNGGKICRTDANADFIISDHLKSAGTVPKAISYKWIEACVDQREMIDTHPYLISTLIADSKKSTGAPAAQGAISPGRSRARREFTLQDDNVLLWWIQHAEFISGNTVYRELATHFTDHSWHAWRNHWVKSLSKEARFQNGPQPPKDFDITKVKGWHAGISRPMGPSLPAGQSLPDVRSDLTDDLKGGSAVVMTDQVRDRLCRLLERDGEDSVEEILTQIEQERPGPASKSIRKVFYEEILPEYRLRKEMEAATPKDVLQQAKRALFMKADDIIYADNRGEQLEACQSLSEKYPNHSADDFLDYFLSKMKPLINKLRKGNSKRDLEQAVLQELQNIDINNSVQEQDDAPRPTGIRLEKPHDPIGQNRENMEKGFPPSRQPPVPNSGPKRLGQSPEGPTRGAVTPPKGQVVASSPTSRKSTISTPASVTKGHVQNIHTHKSASRVVQHGGSSSTDGSPTPRQPRGGLINLTSDDDASIPLIKSEQSVESQNQEYRSPSKRPAQVVPASSPPIMFPPNSKQSKSYNHQIKAPVRPSSPILGSSISSVYPQSEDVPYRKPMTVPQSSVKTIDNSPSSQVQASKRRKLGSIAHAKMVVEATPEKKLFLTPKLAVIESSSPNQLAPSSSQRTASPTLSPLARKSLKRKAPISQKRESFSKDAVVQETDTEEEDGDTEEAESEAGVAADNVFNRNLGFLNDNSPVPRARESSSSLLEAEEALDNRLRQVSPSEGTTDFNRWTDSVQPWAEARAKEFGVSIATVGIIMERTCVDAELTLMILEEIREHLEGGGTMEDFQWPVAAGIWTETDDAALGYAQADEGEDEDEAIGRILKKHGKDRTNMRLLWLARAQRFEKQS
ncbi:hypothetical protein DRE_04377 [Drechslerella stenobrocha 248]|uniref:DNA-binding protein RAP1 n=1 Tax=Drechslerella stenobrocha 248 TaxID=1043628 RepID=W7HT07_9PEZI|nr:hypothetical protein DRE_04377 [Drechslerella stenobrocha 248]